MKHRDMFKKVNDNGAKSKLGIYIKLYLAATIKM